MNAHVQEHRRAECQNVNTRNYKHLFCIRHRSNIQIRNTDAHQHWCMMINWTYRLLSAWKLPIAFRTKVSARLPHLLPSTPFPQPKPPQNSCFSSHITSEPQSLLHVDQPLECPVRIRSVRLHRLFEMGELLQLAKPFLVYRQPDTFHHCHGPENQLSTEVGRWRSQIELKKKGWTLRRLPWSESKDYRRAGDFQIGLLSQ